MDVVVKLFVWGGGGGASCLQGSVSCGVRTAIAEEKVPGARFVENSISIAAMDGLSFRGRTQPYYHCALLNCGIVERSIPATSYFDGLIFRVSLGVDEGCPKCATESSKSRESRSDGVVKQDGPLILSCTEG